MILSLSEKKHSKLLILVAIVISAILISAIALLYRPSNIEAPAQSLLEDPKDDVMLDVGTEYPSIGIIDVINATIGANEGVLNLTITMGDTIPEHLNDGEYAQWNTTIILQDKAYEVDVGMDSTKLTGYVMEIGEEEAVPCTVERYEDSLIISAPIDGLQSTKEILTWSILTWFERWSGDELMINGIDFAPDEDLQRTILEK